MMRKYVSFLLCILMFIPAWGYAQQIRNVIPSDAGDNNPATFRFMPDNTDTQLANKENAPLSMLQVNDGSIAIFVDGQNLCNDFAPMEARKKLIGMDLSNAAGWPDIKVTPGYIAVDPELGRFKFASGDMEKSQLMGKYDALHTAYGVSVQNGYAFVANFQQGLEIINISSPEKPVSAGRYDTTGWAYEVFVSGKYAFVADGYAGLQIINISSPKNPVLLGTCDTPGWAYDVQVVGKYAYVADYRSGVQIIDVSNPLDPFIAGKLEIGGAQCRGIYVSNNYAYIADDKSGMYIVDVSDATHPVLLSTYKNNAQAKGVFVGNNYAYVVNYQSLLEVIDVSNPKNPIVKARLSLPGNLYDIAGFDKYAYIAAGSGGIHIIDLTESINPRLIETFKTDGKAFDIHATDGFVFVAGDYQGLEVINTPYPYESPIGKVTVDYYQSDLKASLTSPNGGEVYSIGSRQNIIWNISGGIPPYTVNLSYAKDGGYQVNPNIVKGLKQKSSGPNAYIWTLPPIVSDRLGVMVSVVDSKGNRAADISDAYFTGKSDASVVEEKAPLLILLKGITGKECLMGGGKLDISWMISGGISPYTVDLSYSIDGGKTYSVMDSNLSQDYYPWTLPSVDSQAVRVKAMVTDASGEKATTVSEIFKLDATSPGVVYTNIPNGQTGIEPGIMPFVIQFSERMDKCQQDIIDFSPFASYTAAWNDTGNILTITPNICLPDATYTCTLNITARDVVGNNLAQSYKWSFKTSREDEINLNVVNISASELSVNGDYKYTSNHGESINLEAEILDAAGLLLEQYNITPVMIKKGKGGFKIAAFYIGTSTINSTGIRLIMSSNGKPFYTKYVFCAREWASSIAAAVKTDNLIYCQGDYVNISLTVNTSNLPLNLRELTFDKQIGDMIIRDSSNNIVFQWSRQNLITAKSVSLLDNGVKILLHATWLPDKPGNYVLEGWLNKSNIYPQIQCPGLRFEVQQMRIGIVSGRITDTVNKQPIGNATVTMGKYNAVTDKNGDYCFAEIDPGVYTIGVQARGYQPYQKEITIKRGTQRQDVAITFASELRFEVILDKQVFGVNEPVMATAVLRAGTRTMTVSGLSLEAESLLLEIETPLSRIVRYIGPFSSGLPPAITLKPGEQISLRLELGQIAFGNKLELVSGYKISSSGRYSLKATYNSWGNQPKRWIGTYQADTVGFSIGTPTGSVVGGQGSGIKEETVVSQPQELPTIVARSGDWEMQIIAQSGQTGQITNTAALGMYSGANAGFDAEFDEPLPPAPADKACIQVYFPRQDWGEIFENFSRDIRGYSTDAFCSFWSFQVKTSSNDTAVTLSFSGIPDGYDIILKSMDDNQSWNLRTTDKCNISGRTLYRFELSVKAYAAKNIIPSNNLSHTFGPGWSLISIPVGSDQQVNSIFNGISTYYLYGYNNKGYGEPAMITAGNAYWLGMIGTSTITVKDNPAAGDISIPLKQGWNMIGCPFTFTPDWSRVMVKKDGISKYLKDAVAAGWVINMLYQYVDGGYKIADRMEAWQGYWFAGLFNCELIILGRASANLAAPLTEGTKACRGGFQTRPFQTSSENWRVGLNVSAGRCRDAANLAPCFGVNPDASSGLDANDRPEPPEPQGGFVTLCFMHPENEIFNRFDWDIRSPADSIAWEFEVKTNLPEEDVAITWDNGCLPQGYNLMLIDKDTQTSMLMDREKGYTYRNCSDGLSVKHFMVRATKAAPVQVQTERMGGFGNLRIYPNPATKPSMQFDGFNGKANIKILTLTGELVKDVSGIQSGYEWMLDNDSGEPVASGLYFYIISDELGDKRVGRLAVIK
ncbi:carboxypeptidase regulatory-like domain-containing protein [Candidatus Desantisbacteria bacterium]|nr:carboxypeptidase regulatory-like domain-containing protein [Candidatus Desantisbacteria bacterium]